MQDYMDYVLLKTIWWTTKPRQTLPIAFTINNYSKTLLCAKQKHNKPDTR
jgi:hypothetical protein